MYADNGVLANRASIYPSEVSCVVARMSKEQRSVRSWGCTLVGIVCGSPGVLSCKMVISIWGGVILYSFYFFFLVCVCVYLRVYVCAYLAIPHVSANDNVKHIKSNIRYTFYKKINKMK